MTRPALRAPRLLAIALSVLAACGPASGDEDIDTEGATLQLDPPTSEHLIMNGQVAYQPFKATLIQRDGKKRDVTAETVFSIDPSIGSFIGSELTLGAAGKTTAFGVFKEVMGSAQVIARVKTVRVLPPLDPSVPDLFDRTEEPARAPTIVYPPDGAVVPRNLGDFEAHWTDPHGNDVFEVSLKTEFADVRVYVPGGNGVAAAGPRPSWQAFAASEWMSVVGIESTVQYQVRGVSTANPTYVGATVPRLVKLSNEPLDGGMYYWAASSSGGGAYGIFRHDMAKPGQPAEEYMTTNQTSNRCVACHVLSRDGTKMAVTYDGGNRNATMIDVATRTRQPDFTQWNFATFTPDATRILTVYNGVISVRNPTDQMVVATMTAGGYATHPDLSPDGKRLVYVRAFGGGSDWSFTGGQIYTRTYDQATNAFGPETPLVTDGVNNFYPSWSPDGQWVLFNRSDGGTSYNNLNASLWVVKADRSAPPIQLAAFNQAAGGLTNSWGRWAPFAQTVGTNQEPIFWVTVSSKRNFGVRRVNSVDAEAAKTPQIWMAPFYPARAEARQDPTTPAFRLPFQNLTSNNHIAQWTERVVIPQ
jgi:WD40-like Beta Propeller Repeat